MDVRGHDMKKKVIYQYTVFIESCTEGGYFANCPSVPGCHVQGETLDEALHEMRAAIDAYLQDLKAHRQPIPKPMQVTVASVGVAI